MKMKKGTEKLTPLQFFDKNMRYFFIAPACIVTIVLLAWPIAISVFYSFTNKSLLGKPLQIVYFDNYISILGNSDFYNAIGNTFVYTFFSILLQLVCGLIVALALNKIVAFKGFFRTLILIPWAFPMIIVTFTWSYILNDLYGIVNGVIASLGFDTILFLANPKLAMITVVLINVWFGVPLFAINILASLQTIPKELYEAAKIDGANAFVIFKNITLPFVKVVMGLLIILRTIWIFNSFDLIFLLTGGGPNSVTETISIYAYKVGMTLYSLGRSSAVTVLLLIILLAACFFYFKILDRWEQEVE